MLLMFYSRTEKHAIAANTAFFVMLVSLFSVLINDADLVSQVSPTLILLSAIVSVHSAFYYSCHRELFNGIIEQLVLQPILLEVFVAKKILYTSLLYQLSFLLVMPIITILTGMQFLVALKLLFVLLLSIPIIITLSLLCGVLSIQQNNGSVITSVLVLPLIIPIMILAHGFIYNSSAYKDLYSLLFLILFTVPINVIAISYLLQKAVQKQ